MIREIEEFSVEVSDLLAAIRANRAAFVSKKSLRSTVCQISKKWLQSISPHLRASSRPHDEAINRLDAAFEKLLELSNSTNRKTTYVNILKRVPKDVQRDILIPLIKTTPTTSILDGVAARVLSLIRSAEEKQYLDEAFRAAKAGCFRAATVMSWCAAVDRLHAFVRGKGLHTFNQTSQQLKAINTGFYKKFTKSFSLTLENELQEVFDKDLIIVISGMVLLDLNQTAGLLRLFDIRNSCAHASAYTIDELPFANFLNEICNLILENPKLA
jgi:hypothetical protein